MYRFCPIVLVYAIIIISAVFVNTCGAAVVITPASGLCLNNTPGAYSSIGTITIQEGAMADFSVETGVTFILSAPAGFEFLAGTGSVSYTAGRNITTASLIVTGTSLTVTYTCSGINKADRIVISAIQARGITPGSAGNILRTGGTATMTGNAVVDGLNHGNLTSSGSGILVSSIANGNWSSATTWSTGSVPSCGQDVIISHNVTSDITSSIANITITTGGNLVAMNAITVSGTFTLSGTGTYTHNNSYDASGTIFAGSESFSSTSNLVINQWYDLNIPLAFSVSSSLGNITFNVAGTWQQDGYFAPSKIQGNLVISSGTVVLDDGTGMSTSITLQDVTITGAGNLTACAGTNRNFTFNTNNFTDNGTTASLTSIMSSCTGILNWTANGNVILNDHFALIKNAGSPPGVSMTVTGNLDITGGDIDFLETTDAPFALTVNGRTGITGSPGHVSLVNSGSGSMTFNTSSLEVSAAATIEFITGSFAGPSQFTITNNLEISGSSTSVYMINVTGYTSTLNLVTGMDILVTDADFYIANSNGPVQVLCGRYMTISGSTSEFNGQSRTSNSSPVDINISGNLTITNATFYHTRGQGAITLTVGEIFEIDNGNFYGISHTVSPAASTAVFNFQDFVFGGGMAKFFTLKTSSPTVVTVNCTNNFSINWESNTDVVELVSYDGNNDASLVLTIGGNFSITGNYPNACFLSSKAGGDENVSITGNVSVSGGKVFFVCDNTSTSGVDAHNITTVIGGNIDISGGVTFLSARDGLAAINVGGDVLQSGGILNLKWLTGITTLTIGGSFIQTGGIFNLHSHTSSSSDTIKVIVNGDFNQTAGIFNFDNVSGTGMAEHVLTINGPAFTIGGTAQITHANNLSANYVFGQIYFNRPGTTVYSRTSSTHTIGHIRQTIQAGTTVDASSSAHGFQMTSMASSNVSTHNALTIIGTLDMGDKTLSAREQASYYSRLTLVSGARYRTSHTGGLYSGSNSVASSINGYILTLNRVGYNLSPSSIIEYYGTNTSAVTGVPNGIATGVNQQYGILEINFTGVPGSAWVYPETANEVRIRNTLVLTNGEFNLDSDHVTSGGGRAINLETGATINRTTGFLRSETEDGSGVVKWNITTNSTNTIPFGYDASNHIPFTFQQTSGTSGIVEIGTFRTMADNTPFPPTVTHVRDVNGFDNSAETVDRFWNISVPGTASANLIFTYTPSEGSGIISPRAQQWEPVTAGWFLPAGIQSNPTATSATAGGLSSFNTWWTLASLASPLPIELALFEVVKKGAGAEISWITQSEINNDYFTIERSADGIHFEPLQTIDGAGTSTTPLHYSVQDQHPLAGRNYYRLKQTDFDGHFTYSGIKSIVFTGDGNFLIYPNPVSFHTNITIEVPDEGIYEIRIADITGRLIHTSTSNTGENLQLLLNPSAILLSEGWYSVTITGLNTFHTQKILIRK